MLAAMGHTFDKSAGSRGEHWGDAEGILIDPISGIRHGASDPRSADAAAVGY